VTRRESKENCNSGLNKLILFYEFCILILSLKVHPPFAGLRTAYVQCFDPNEWSMKNNFISAGLKNPLPLIYESFALTPAPHLENIAIHLMVSDLSPELYS